MFTVEDAPRESQSCSGPNIFSCIAPIYDWMNLLISFGLIRFWRDRAARYLALKAGETGLDLGTGTADLAIAIIQASEPGAHVIAIDKAPEMLERGERKLRQLALHDRIELRRGDVTSIDVPDNSVDGCCSAFLVRNLADIPQSFWEMRRVVRPGGRVVCLEVSHPPSNFFRHLFHCYFYTCAPFFGLLLGQRFEAYRYLPASLKHFPDAPHLKVMMEACGWSDVCFHHLNGGLVAIHLGTKREVGCTGFHSVLEAKEA
ncbi:demethylmenaquinone methyltransferase [Ktedonobacter sp. SOSP1-52]|uniref:ubiquinone/menaquinone biosynthesis methyltransferase n=1 Tax=Ktedonobacter sp. SOSP1-52 TaxID=2778366 RepID=UPI001914EDFD|nr:ubiquinone/menaquinone biosynthesis methyltransferase [Ktedonobacter sp. SOSP1-52]GHO63451.1 demethylmenaquinone methyltransferase [Ktedonobacter sp. SOSP1-52]